MSPTAEYEFDEVGRLPLAGDNMAIATRRLEGGSRIRLRQTQFVLDHTIMEGHRFAIGPIDTDEFLLSWGLPFGIAIRPIVAGNYVCNEGILAALGIRALDFQLPSEPNFRDRIEPYQLDETFQPGVQAASHDTERTFAGFDRGGSRGVGTRNYIVVLGTSSRTSSYARLLAQRVRERAASCPHIDGVVAVAHTEGGGYEAPNNRELLLRTLAGFLIHPNVGAILAVDAGTESVTNRMLSSFATSNGYPLDQVVHHFATLDGDLESKLVDGERRLVNWMEAMSRFERRDHSVAHLRLAMQCGGSDAFSGISGNPLASWAAREIIRNGGSANLAETDELIGAEPYLLQNVRDAETAETFLSMIARFKERMSWHGSSAEGNPSGGNKFRGLYNIALKSIGAAMKRHPDVCLDYVIDYGERMREPGYYFMDSPGNDLESIAGQVASGCNMIYFVTGNGSITNFPFVPTIKIVTTTARYELLAEEMDFNAGAFLEARPMDELGQGLFERTLDVASGERSQGEAAGHSQVSIWRDWRQTDDRNLSELCSLPAPSGKTIPVQAETAPRVRLQVHQVDRGHATARYGLILPTSLCAGQIARMAAERLNENGMGRDRGLRRLVALVHTEGCGLTSPGSTEQMQLRTMVGYLTHPLVQHALLLEHGCEQTHNDYYREQIKQLGLDVARFGFASVQLDGGIGRVLENIETWFSAATARDGKPQFAEVGVEGLHLGIDVTGDPSDEVADYLGRVTRWIVSAGGTIVIPANSPLLETAAFRERVFLQALSEPCLSYGQRPETTGCYVMETPSEHWVETMTGLGATGIELALVHVVDRPVQGHPLIPVLQVASNVLVSSGYGSDLDLTLGDNSEEWGNEAVQLLVRVVSGKQSAKASEQGNIDFQLTRGLLGIST